MDLMVCEVCGNGIHPREDCPYIRKMVALLKSCCLPVWFTNESGRRAHGSMVVVDTGEAVLGITAGHVADRILECCRDESSQRCQLGSMFLPVDGFIARHSDLDLATFRLSSSAVLASGHRPAVASVWPPITPQLNDTVLLGGYPGLYRREDAGRFQSDFAYFGARVTDLDKRSFSVEIPMANSIGLSRELMPPNVDLAGASGGGVFRLTELQSANNLIGALDLTGIIYFGSPGFDVINAHQLSIIKSTGEFV
jgi:hypothetical protein